MYVVVEDKVVESALPVDNVKSSNLKKNILSSVLSPVDTHVCNRQ